MPPINILDCRAGSEEIHPSYVMVQEGLARCAFVTLTQKRVAVEAAVKEALVTRTAAQKTEMTTPNIQKCRYSIQQTI